MAGDGADNDQAQGEAGGDGEEGEDGQGGNKTGDPHPCECNIGSMAKHEITDGLKINESVEEVRRRAVAKSKIFADWVRGWLKRYEAEARLLEVATTYEAIAKAAKAMEEAIPGGDTWDYSRVDYARRETMELSMVDLPGEREIDLDLLPDFAG